MKIKVIGDVIAITTDIDLDKLEKFGPVLIKDKEGQVVYGANYGQPMLTSHGIQTNIGNNDGKAVVTEYLVNDADGSVAAMIATNYGESLEALQANEAKVVAELKKKEENFAKLIEKIEVE